MGHHGVGVVLHGHFYQPPRANPWTGEVPEQAGARPYHDWNERITAECYRPNTASRVLDPAGRIRAIVNNFEFMSFNVGPTLMQWLERHHPDVVARIVAADAASQQRLGHGNAIAQAYHHMILPLANARDRRTQVLWGLREFKHRFGRDAEGVWLPETAIHADTVDDLIACGVRFTVLSPHQAKRVRPLAGGEWQMVGHTIDPKRPYRIRGAHGHLDVFFCDGPISRAVAFEGLLRHSAGLADRVARAADPTRNEAQLVSVAVDGETFGHHWGFGDMCLASFFLDAAAARDLQITNYAACLAAGPPAQQVELQPGPDGEGTAWSCPHGLGRWLRDCGCSAGSRQGWTQAWRGPLRLALDALRDAVAVVFEERGAQVLHDPWQARDEYIDVVNVPGAVDAFLERHLRGPASPARRVQALELLEAQRHAMAMYTSCGWFFADPGGIETIQNLRYAARCLQHMQPWADDGLERMFLADLTKVRCNFGSDVATLYRHLILPESRTAWHAANARGILRLLRVARNAPTIYCFDVKEEAASTLQIDGHNAVSACLRLRDRNTEREWNLSYVAVEFGAREHRSFLADAAKHDALLAQLTDSTDGKSPAELRHWLAGLFERELGIGDLLAEQQQRIARRLAEERVEGLQHHYRAVFDDSVHLLEDFASLGLELPDELRAPCEFVLAADLVRAAQRLVYPFDEVSTRFLRQVIEQARRFRIEIDNGPAARALQNALSETLRSALREPQPAAFDAVDRLLDLIESLRLDVDRTEAEGLVYAFLRRHLAPNDGDSGPSPGDGMVNRCLALAPRFNLCPDVLPEALRTGV